MSHVEVRSVTREYGGAGELVVPLKEVSLSIERGERIALMGPSGSGKTTLLHLIAGIDSPTSGEVVVAGETVSSMTPRALARFRARRIGLIFQSWNLIPVLDAYENVEVPLLLRRLSRSERDRKVRTALAAVGLLDRSSHLPRQLSGGQQQRVAIARAIVSDPEVLLADEPTGNLDGEAAATVLDLLSRLSREFDKTLVIVTHDPGAAKIAGRVLHLDGGVLREETVDA